MSAIQSEIEFQLKFDRIRALTPDYPTFRSAVDLAYDNRWPAEGFADGVAWATIQEVRPPLIYTAIRMPDLLVGCTCKTAKFPCRHMLALLLRQEVGLLADNQPPEWVEGLLRSPDRPESRGPTPEEKYSAALAGLLDFDRWLGDVMRQGLAGLPARGRAWWTDAADRLIDAYAIGPARELRDLASLPGSQANWPERVLPRLGRLALLVDGFKRLAELPIAMQEDILAAVGLDSLHEPQTVRDLWLVLGHQQDVVDAKLQTRVWLRGRASRRWALLETSHSPGSLHGQCYPLGATLSGTLAFRPSSHSLPATALDLRPLDPPLASPVPARGDGTADIATAIRDHAAALAANPWLRSYPILLNEVIVEPAAGNWRLRDRAGYTLPLPNAYDRGWQLLAMSAGRPLAVFGTWDGAVLRQLGVHDGQEWVNPAIWRGIR